MHLDAPNPGLMPFGKQGDGLPVFHRPRPHGARRHGAKPRAGEHPIDGHAKGAFGRPLGIAKAANHSQQLVFSAPVDSRKGDDRRPFQEGARYRIRDVLDGQLEKLLVDEIGHRQGNGALARAEQSQDGQVLASLRHRAVHRADTQQDRIDPGRTCNHGANETLMPRNVDQTHAPPIREV